MPAPQVNNVSPNSGDVVGGEEVTITGHYFTGATAVDFGATAATSFTVVSATEITVVAPTVPDFVTGVVDVTVTTPSGTSATSGGDHFTFTAPTTSDLLNAITAVGAQVTANTSQILALQTSVGEVASAVTDVLLLVTPAPTVTSLTPAAALNTGGATVVIGGTGFTAVTAVNFGAVAATSFTIDSDTQITAIAPAESVGTVYLTVTNWVSETASSTDQFTYVSSALPTVTSVAGGITGEPEGADTGGYNVGITGTGLEAVTSVHFGTTPAEIFPHYGYYNAEVPFTVIAPAGTDGTVDVTVTTLAGTSNTSSADQFTYFEPPLAGISAPAVTEVSPSSGPAVGGTSVTISCSNAATDQYPGVNFGTTPAEVSSVSGSSVTVISPPGTGTVDVTVSTSRGGTSATTAADQFTYD